MSFSRPTRLKAVSGRTSEKMTNRRISGKYWGNTVSITNNDVMHTTAGHITTSIMPLSVQDTCIVRTDVERPTAKRSKRSITWALPPYTMQNAQIKETQHWLLHYEETGQSSSLTLTRTRTHNKHLYSNIHTPPEANNCKKPPRTMQHNAILQRCSCASTILAISLRSLDHKQMATTNKTHVQVMHKLRIIFGLTILAATLQ